MLTVKIERKMEYGDKKKENCQRKENLKMEEKGIKVWK